MAKKNTTIRVLTALLAMVMMLSTMLTVHMSATGTTYYGTSPSIQQVSGLDIGLENLYDKSVTYKLPDTVKADFDISVIIETKSSTLLDAYDKSGSSLSFGEYVLTDEAAAIREKITAE